jgi:predicted transposase YdaD
MIDIAKTTKILEDHFATATPDEFAKNLREFCPELFEGEQQNNIHNDPVKNTEIYRKAKEEGKIEVAPRLLQRGFTIKEVAEILEIDINLIAS